MVWPFGKKEQPKAKKFPEPLIDEEELEQLCCEMCREVLNDTVECQDGCHFCMDCIGSFADVSRGIKAGRSTIDRTKTRVNGKFKLAADKKQSIHLSVDDELTLHIHEHVIKASGKYEFRRGQDRAKFQDAIRHPQRCANCDADGTYQRAHAVDAHLKRSVVGCPVSSCDWRGPFRTYRAHVRSKHPDSAVDSDEEEIKVAREMKMNGKTLRLEKDVEGGRTKIRLEMTYNV